MIIENTIASKKLLNGPANETKKRSLLGFLKYRGFIGTGFAHPTFTMSRAMAPIGSKCFMGFRESLPALFAVGSPNTYAV